MAMDTAFRAGLLGLRHSELPNPQSLLLLRGSSLSHSRGVAKRSLCVSVLRSALPGRETIGDDVMRIFLKDRQLNGDFISKVSDMLWQRDNLIHEDSEISIVHENSQQHDEMLENESRSGYLKLTRAREWVSGDNVAPMNKKFVVKEQQNDSEKRKKLNLLKYEALKRELLLLTTGIGAACSAYCLVNLSVEAAISYASGVFFSCLYLQLLYHHTDNLSRAAVAEIFMQKKLKKIGIRSQDLKNMLEKTLSGTTMALSSPRLVIPVAIYGIWALSHHFLNNYFDFQTKQFREGTDSFGVSSAVVSKKRMNPAEWWIHFGHSAQNLKAVAIRILSQTVSSSGCERNWSIFSLIHSKQRNRLTQKRLNDLVYVHYNLRLRLKCIQDEVQLKYADPMLGDYADGDEDPMIGWLAGQQLEPELDEPGSPQRPASLVAREIRVDPGRWADTNIPHRVPADQPQPEGTQRSHSSHDSMSETSSQMFEREFLRRTGRPSQAGRRDPSSQMQQSKKKDKAKGKTIAASSSVQESTGSDSETDDSSDGSDDQGGAGGQETVVHETQPQGGIRFTGESQFTHATQDRDHAAPADRGREGTISYRRRPFRGRQAHDAAADDLAREVGSMDVSGSSSYSGSYHPQAAYDPYGYGYDASETSSSSGYYPMQPGASHGSDFAAGIFGWAPPQPYHYPRDTSQRHSLSERSEMSYNPERLPYGTNIQDYHASWIEGWTVVPPEYENDPDIRQYHRYSTRF